MERFFASSTTRCTPAGIATRHNKLAETFCRRYGLGPHLARTLSPRPGAWTAHDIFSGRGGPAVIEALAYCFSRWSERAAAKRRKPDPVRGGWIASLLGVPIGGNRACDIHVH